MFKFFLVAFSNVTVPLICHMVSLTNRSLSSALRFNFFITSVVFGEAVIFLIQFSLDQDTLFQIIFAM